MLASVIYGTAFLLLLLVCGLSLYVHYTEVCIEPSLPTAAILVAGDVK